MKYKTLKDIEGKIHAKALREVAPQSGAPLLNFNGSICSEFTDLTWVKRLDLKREVIKWIKEDYLFLNSNSKYMTPENIIRKWMFRLNITEEDLE